MTDTMLGIDVSKKTLDARRGAPAARAGAAKWALNIGQRIT